MSGHNHTRFRNDDGPWSVCPSTCPESTSVMGELHRLREVVARVEGLVAEWDARHSGWCCTVDCPEPKGRHHDPTDPVHLSELVGMWSDNPPPLIEHRTIPCPGTCTCQVGPYIAAARDALSGLTPVPGSMDSDPALTERHSGSRGAGDGV